MTHGAKSWSLMVAFRGHTHFFFSFNLWSLILVVSFCALFNIKRKMSFQFKRNEIVHVCVYIVINSNIR